MEKEGNNLFQVNLKGMIALLSEHIYSNPNTFVRELLQNCVDAITALRNIDENYAGRIDVFLNDDKTVIFRDNGIGLKEEEVYRFLTVIGESSKRDTPDADDFIGRFGIGLLSCFVVTDEIKVESRSAMGAPLDGKGLIGGELYEMPLERKAPGVIFRQPVNQPLQTGLKAVDAMIPIGRGQLELIIGEIGRAHV